MVLEKTYIPHGAYWSTPFCRWQGALSGANSVELAAATAKRFLQKAGISPETLDEVVLGLTVPQHHSFYGAPWAAALLGAPGVTGPTISQACATSARVLATAALQVEAGMRSCVLGLACDRTSNGPHIYYPDPKGVGGRGATEEWVWDNFNCDPWARNAMIQTAENVAREKGITREEQDEVTLLRSEQYQAALANDGAFHKRVLFPAEIAAGRKKTITVAADEGVFPTTKEGLAKLKPVLEGGTVTFGTQTYPADGNAGMLLCSREQLARLGKEQKPLIRLLSFGQTRVKKGFMPMAVVPAAREALDAAGVKLEDLRAIKTHNPFAINDVYFCRETGVKPEKLNRYGSPLIYGHPQGPTGLRVVAELIEELVEAGGGLGLFSGCAAGDTAMALVVRVE